ncbi:MAG TPA: Arm DNA-binding domain-containing protein [Xanthobacteraceae bacterium]|jgi:hypothetical protein
MPLTVFEIEATEASEKAYKLSDGDGLFLLVKGESKLWRFRYHHLGKENMRRGSCSGAIRIIATCARASRQYTMPSYAGS